MRPQPTALHRLSPPTLSLLASLLLSPPPSLLQAAPAPLTLSTNRHHLVTTNGTPFFYLADAAWELIHRADLDDAQHYLRNRARKGFTVIHSAILAELDGVRTPNALGDLPFIDLDPGQPNPAFFNHIDQIVNEAASLGLHLGLAPTWGDKINRRWGAGPGQFFNDETAASYGTFLGQRYKAQPVIWILGGDRNPETDPQLATWRAMAEGLKTGSDGLNLVTYLPMAGTPSSKWFSNDPWLDINLFHSGQTASATRIRDLIRQQRQNTPVRPVIDGEGRLADHPIDWNPANGRFDDWDVRQAAYVSLLSGAAGHACGNHNVWQFWTPDRPSISAAQTPWREALEHPAADQMGWMRRFFECRPWQELQPGSESTPPNPQHQASSTEPITARSADGTFLYAYSAEGPIPIDLQQLTGRTLKGYWCNPRDGAATPITAFKNDREPKSFSPPTTTARTDWLLLLEDAAREFTPP